MKQDIAVCVVGGGSCYTAELIEGILAHSYEDLPVTEIRLQDIAADRMTVVAGLARRMIAHRKRDISVTCDTQLKPMLQGVDFVLTQIRVGGMEARQLDETIPLNYGIIGQETTGPGGMFKALRTIPPMLEICRTVSREAPDAFVLSYTNPSGIVTEAIQKHAPGRFVGMCSGMPGIIRRLRQRLVGRFPDPQLYCVGLNHLGFAHRVVSDGRDVTCEAMDMVAKEMADSGESAQVALGEMVRIFGAVPIGYAGYYCRRAARLGQAKAAEKTRAETIMDIEKEVLEQASDPTTVTKPKALAKRGGGGYSQIALSFMKAILRDTGDRLPCTVLNQGCVEGLDDDAGVEIVCRVGQDGPRPIPVGAIPLAFRGLVQTVKAYETLTVQAAVERRRSLVIQALLNHPLAGDLDVIVPLVDDMLTAHGLDYD